MSDFEPVSGYSKNRTSTVFTNGTDNQRGEFTLGLSDDWSIEKFDADKTSILATNGTDEQRAVVVWNLNGEGGGSGGTTNYNQLSNKPQVNSVTLQGNKTDSDLHLLGSYTEIPTASAELSGKIVHFAGEGGSTPSSATVTSDRTDWYKYLTIDKTKFENTYNPTGDVVVEFLSHNDSGNITWTLDGVTVDINEYGIEYDDESSPASGIKIFVDYKAGTTNYVNGYFYKCTAQGTTPETYAWEQINVQPNSGGTIKIMVEGTTTVESFRVPDPTAAELVAIYNAIAAGTNVFIVDPYDVYYQVLQADATTSKKSIEILYFGIMSIIYTLEGSSVSLVVHKFQDKITGTSGNVLYIDPNGNIGNVPLNTSFTALSDPDEESLSGLIQTQAELNKEIREAISNIETTLTNIQNQINS